MAGIGRGMVGVEQLKKTLAKEQAESILFYGRNGRREGNFQLVDTFSASGLEQNGHAAGRGQVSPSSANKSLVVPGTTSGNFVNLGIGRGVVPPKEVQMEAAKSWREGWRVSEVGLRGGNMGGFSNPGFSRSFLKAQEREQREQIDSFPCGRAFEDKPKNNGIGFKEIMEEVKKASEKKWRGLPEIRKNFYQEHPEVTAMFPDEVADLRKKSNNITVTDLREGANREPPKPVFMFEHAFANYPELLEQLKDNFGEPTPVQKQLWPIVLSGEDAIGIAQTGTGKTLGFLLPAFIHIDNQPVKGEDRDGPACLILTPTRELALQIHREVKKYLYRGIKSVCVYGGGDRKSQVSVCTEGVDIVIATPGRLNDLVYAGVIPLRSITFLARRLQVLDEADRMLDMGFEPQIKKILLDVRPDRHTVLTSATWPRIVREIASKYTVDPFLINVGSLDLAACHAVQQSIEIMEEEDKFERLMTFVRNMAKNHKVLIFVGRKSTADHLSSELIRNGIECQSMHGDRDQMEREKALRELRKGRVRILVATDVASRGLDIQDITHVLNYDFPHNIEEYVHRVGRTGRAGKTGQAISLMTFRDSRNARELIRILNEAHQEVPPELVRMAGRFEASQERRRELYSRAPRERERERRGFLDPYTGEYVGKFA